MELWHEYLIFFEYQHNFECIGKCAVLLFATQMQKSLAKQGQRILRASTLFQIYHASNDCRVIYKNDEIQS